MDPLVVEEIRKIGKNAEACGRILQTTRKRWLTQNEVRDIRMALRELSKALYSYEKMIPKQ